MKDQTKKNLKNFIKYGIGREVSYDSNLENNVEGDVFSEHKLSMLISVGIFVVVTVISFFFNKVASDPTLNIAMLYTLAVFLIGRYTRGYIYGVLFTLASVVSVNFFFTYPYNNLNFSLEGYQVTFLGMLVIGIITSVLSTTLRQQEIKIAQQERELNEAQKEKMKANLLRAVSHDIRTPLTGIIGSSQSILENGDGMTADEKKELVGNIQHDADWMLNMVENLLSITRINNETAKVNKQEEVVDEVVESAVTKFKKRFPDKKVVISLPDEPDIVNIDPILIEQVILNVLQNAVMHSESEKPVDLIVTDEEDEATFTIRDYGKGIDKNKLATLFEGTGGFSESAGADSHKGMGIGLSICKTIVNAHGGEIRAKNHADGAEFSFTLPKETEV